MDSYATTSTKCHECVTSFELANDTANKQKELRLIRKLSLSLSVSV